MLCRFLVGNLGLFRPTDVRYLRDAMRKQVGTSYANAMATDPVAELFYCNCVGVWNKIKKTAIVHFILLQLCGRLKSCLTTNRCRLRRRVALS